MRLRRRTTLLLVFAVLLLLAFGYGWHAWRSLLREQGVERLEWQGLGLSAEGIGLRRLALERRGADGASLRLDVEHALLRWPGLSGWRPRLPGLRVEQVALAWQPAAASSDDDSAALDWTSLRETLAWLPEQIHLERFHRPALSRRPLRAGRRTGHRPPVGSAVSAGCATAPATGGAAGPARRPALRGAYRLAPADARATRPAGATDAGQPARAVRWRRPLAGAPGGARPAGHPWPGGLAQSLVAGSPAPARRTASPASASGLDDPPGAWQRLAGAAPGARRRWLGGAAGAGSASLAAARSG